MDTFLQSGIKSDGSEFPQTRSLPIGSEAENVVLKWVNLQTGTLHWHPEEGFTVGLHMGIDEWSGTDDCQSRTDIEIARLFSLFMESEVRWRIVRCHKCSTYVIPKNLRPSYAYGWHCSLCRKNASATILTRNSRKVRKKKRLELAVAAWTKSEGKRDHIRLVTDEVNESLAWYEKIKQNTISRMVRENPEIFHLKTNSDGGKK